LANAEPERGEGASRRSLGHLPKAGEALIKAKAAYGHGKWLAWLKQNIRFNERQAQRYMGLAKCDVTSDLDDQWRILSGNAPEAHSPRSKRQ
jgi:hypothetical protein